MKKLIVLFVLFATVTIFTGCASTARVIEHASLQTKVALSEPVFLNIASQDRTVYVKVTNTSDVQNIPLEPLVKDRLAKKNLDVVDNPIMANWIVQANITSLVYNKLGSMGEDTGRIGAAIGGIAGALIPGTSRDSWLGAAVGSIVGNVAGAVAGALVKIESYTGNVDLQIQEKVSGGVKGVVKTEVKQGTSTKLITEKEVQTDYQTYRTNMSIEATQTNINLEEAVSELTNKLADQIAGLF